MSVLPLSHLCRAEVFKSLRETNAKQVRHTEKKEEKKRSLTSCCGNDTSCPYQIFGYWKQHRGFCFSSLSYSTKQSPAANVQRYWKNCVRNVWHWRGFKVSETVSQLCPAGTVSECAPVVSAHEQEEREGDRYKHSWALVQWLVRCYDRRGERGFQGVVHRVVF